MTEETREGKNSGLEKQQPAEPPLKSKDTGCKRFFLGAFLIIVPFIMILFIIEFWPLKVEPPTSSKPPAVASPDIQAEARTDSLETQSVEGKSDQDNWSKKTLLLGLEISHELRLLLLVLIAGALGSYIHAATSFSDFIGNRKFHPSWYWWYWLRLPIGSVLALIVFMIIKGSLLVIQTEVSTLRPFSVMGFAALSGMFSKQAIDKLNEIFNSLFKNKVDEGRTDKLSNEKNKNTNENANNK